MPRTNADASLITKATGCKGEYALLNLPNHDIIHQTAPDAMHTIKDAVVNLYELIIGKDDTTKCRTCEINLGRNFGMNPTTCTSKVNRKEPIVTYSLSTKDINLANQRSESIITPVHIDFVPGKLFSKTSGLKSHDWKQVGIYSYKCKSHIAVGTDM